MAQDQARLQAELTRTSDEIREVKSELAKLKSRAEGPDSEVIQKTLLTLEERLTALHQEQAALQQEKTALLQERLLLMQGAAPAIVPKIKYTLELIKELSSDKVKVYRILGGEAGAEIPLYFVDTNDIVGQLTAWLDTRQKYYTPDQPGDQVPLFLNGFVKSGKSHLLNVVLPAVVGEHPFYGKGGKAPMRVCALDFAELTNEGSNTLCETLCAWLQHLQGWAQANGLQFPITQLGPHSDVVDLHLAIIDFIESVKVPVLYTYDEVQWWFLIKDDHQGCAGPFFKRLFTQVPSWAAAAVTGSSMCLFWGNVAAMAPNGTTLAVHQHTISLPSTSKEGAAAAWKYLQEACPALPDAIQQLAPPQPSLLTQISKQWLSGGRPSDVGKFVTYIEKTKLLIETANDFGKALVGMSPEQRKLLLCLAIRPGLDLKLLTEPGLVEWLEPLLTKTGTNTWRLMSSYHCKLITMFLTASGEIQNPLLQVDSSAGPLAVVLATRAIEDFGNAVTEQQRDDKNHGWLKSLFEELLANNKGWLSTHWVELLRAHPANRPPGQKSAADGYDSLLAEIGPSTDDERHWKLLAQGHRMFRNVAAHKTSTPEDEEKLYTIMKHYPFAPTISSIPDLLMSLENKYMPAAMSGDSSSKQGSSSSSGGRSGSSAGARKNRSTRKNKRGGSGGGGGPGSRSRSALSCEKVQGSSAYGSNGYVGLSQHAQHGSMQAGHLGMHLPH